MTIPRRVYHVKLTLEEPLLGTAPKDPEVYAAFIASKAVKVNAGNGIVDRPDILEEIARVRIHESIVVGRSERKVISVSSAVCRSPRCSAHPAATDRASGS